MWYKRHHFKMAVLHLLHLKQLRIECAMRLQRVYRTSVARSVLKLLAKRKRSAKLIQNNVRMHFAKNHRLAMLAGLAMRLSKQESALVIQQAQRCRVARQVLAQLRLREKSAFKIQCMFMSRQYTLWLIQQDELKLKAELPEKSAIQIQQVVRQKTAREELARRKKNREEKKRMMKAIMTLQRLLRRQRANRLVIREQLLSLPVQIKGEFVHKWKSAIVIQATVRGRRARRRRERREKPAGALK